MLNSSVAKKFCRSCAALSLWLLAGSAQALSYVPLEDEPLYDGADAIVVGSVSAAANPADVNEVSHYRLSVQQVLKGDASLADIDVRVPGVRDRSREGALIVPGAPQFDDDEQVMVFLNHRADGSWSVSQMVLGAFHVRGDGQGGHVAQRDLSEAEPMVTGIEKSASALAGEGAQVRDLEKFSAWIKARGEGVQASSDYWTAAPVTQFTPKFAVSSQPGRWFEFDSGGSVTLYAAAGGQTSLSGGGYEEFQRGIAAWNNDPGSNINYVYGGTSGAAGGINVPDNVSEILFNDLLDDITGIFDCSNGGILAYGGYRTVGTGSFNGATFARIKEADIVVQDGAGCALSGNRRSNAAEVFAHEIGHTLGLMHSCGDEGMAACTPGSAANEALMRPSMHGDGRGASLSADDKAGVAYLYGASNSSTPVVVDNGSAAASGGGGAFGGGLGLMLGVLLRLCRGRRRTP